MAVFLEIVRPSHSWERYHKHLSPSVRLIHLMRHPQVAVKVESHPQLQLHQKVLPHFDCGKVTSWPFASLHLRQSRESLGDLDARPLLQWVRLCPLRDRRESSALVPIVALQMGETIFAVRGEAWRPQIPVRRLFITHLRLFGRVSSCTVLAIRVKCA